MDRTRKTARIAGWFFIITFITSIPALFFFYEPVLNHADYIVGSGAATRVSVGAFLEVLLVIANIGTAVVLFPILKRQSEGIALGYVAARIVESTIIAVGIISVLSVVTLRQHSAGTDDGALVAVGRSLVALHDWTFLLGPGLVIGINSLLLAYLMYRSRLVPRWIAVLGLVGGPLVFASSTAVMFGLYDQVSALAGLAALPVTAWEMSLAAYLVVKGFKPSPLTAPGRPSEQRPAAMTTA
jgi:Domain of unknown function (DUF4386)